MKLILSFVIGFLVYVPNYSIAQYEFLKNVEQWPPATCLRTKPNTKCIRHPKNFTLHGLWPSNSSSSSDPETCTRTPFKSTLIHTLFPRVNVSWPDITKGKEESFWAHEWSKHGTCSEVKFNMLEYFTRALDIKDKVYILKALNDANIKPDSIKQHPILEIKKAIAKVTGKDPELRCFQLDNKPEVYLHEIGLCLDFDGINFINCPPRPKDNAVSVCSNNNAHVFLLPL
ncbi:unnamed protein product [Lathyrus sativus]|nr:unnamed protein product [Lathyrus sativus]